MPLNNIGNPVMTGTPGQQVIEVDPVSRIEGHLGVKLHQTGGYVDEANVHGNLWRGFENFLLGREINDAITFTQRICGVCPVPHGMTATYAADAVLGYSRSHITFVGPDADNYGVPAKAVYIRNLVLGAEFLMSSITHFYHLAAPSYVQGPAIPPWTPYFGATFYDENLRSVGHGTTHGGNGVAPASSQFGTNSATKFSIDLWSTIIRSYVKALRIRRLTFDAGALFAGRMPMTSVYVGGGVTFDKTENLTNRCDKFRAIMQEVGQFVVKEYVPIVLALGYLYKEFDNKFNNGQLAAAPDVSNTWGWGAGVGNFLAWGAFPNPTDDSLAVPGGVYMDGTGLAFSAANKTEIYQHFIDPESTNRVPANLKEDITNSRYADTLGEYDVTTKQAYPGAVSRTEPRRSNGYTYAKAPRWNGKPMEVGPFARLVVAGLYPVDGTMLAAFTKPAGGAVGSSGLSAHYVKYVNSFAPAAGEVAGAVEIGTDVYYGLDPRMIEPDIAVALVRAGLADVRAAATGELLPVTTPAEQQFIVDHYFDGAAIVTGPLAQWIIGLKGGLSTMDRLRARGLESLVLVQAILGGFDKLGASGTGTWAGGGWIDGLAVIANSGSATWAPKTIPVGQKQGWGATEAPRGALMHQCTIVNGKITKYQCIVPTTWNMAPKDYLNQRGPMEQAMIGAEYSIDESSFTNQEGDSQSTQSGVEALRIAQSFDPCIACAVH